ncbi:hypothetical protein HELRODRAFT_183941 [Helobdella robusta]|uniref:SAYSvFN domain-containing protein n=1 Tax=Helobdella robusta TaxID=6412 RepID=T1FKB9_HELRO|nr:hypothetical protein HELRODRAFT_183941 [Helobdella robusta]ESO09723.1 hypothetical protein HELRODRAFT_183941 [Helobdella robusta]
MTNIEEILHNYRQQKQKEQVSAAIESNRPQSKKESDHKQINPNENNSELTQKNILFFPKILALLVYILKPIRVLLHYILLPFDVISNYVKSTPIYIKTSQQIDRIPKIISWTIIFVLWCLLWSLAISVEFGCVFLIISGILFICLNTRTRDKLEGEPSAYSVFNENCEAIKGKPQTDEKVCKRC